MLTDSFGQIIEVEKRIIFCPKSRATWKDFQKSSRLAKSLIQFAKDLRKFFQGARKLWADWESLVKLPKRFANISHTMESMLPRSTLEALGNWRSIKCFKLLKIKGSNKPPYSILTCLKSKKIEDIYFLS
jgi:hypothetical protein